MSEARRNQLFFKGFPHRRTIGTISLLLLITLLIGSCAVPSSNISSAQYFATGEAARQSGFIAADQEAQQRALSTAAAAEATGQARLAIENVTRQAEATRIYEAEQAALATAEMDRQLGELAVEATALHLDMISAGATATASYDNLRTQQELIASQQLMRQQDEDHRLMQSRRQIAMIALYIGVFVIAVLFAVGIVYAGTQIAIAFRKRQERPIVVQVSAGDYPMTFYQDGRGGYSPAPEPSRPRLLPANSSPTAIDLPELDMHVFVLGHSDSGKSSTLRALIDQCGKKRERVTVIDPHYRPHSWPAKAKVISTNQEIIRFFKWMEDELETRVNAGHNGQYSFRSFTVVIDEIPIMANTYGRNMWEPVKQWLYAGRKYGLFMILGSHTTLVKALGIEGESVIFAQFKHVLYLGRDGQAVDSDLYEDRPGRAIWRKPSGELQAVKIPYDPAADPESAEFRNGRSAGRPYMQYETGNPEMDERLNNGTRWWAAQDEDEDEDVIILPGSTSTPPEIREMRQEQADGIHFDAAPWEQLTSRNKAACWLVNREPGSDGVLRAGGKDLERLDRALQWRVDNLDCRYSKKLLGIS